MITGTASEIANGESHERVRHPQPAIMSIEEAKASLMREMSDEDNKYGDLGTGMYVKSIRCNCEGLTRLWIWNCLLKLVSDQEVANTTK